MTEGRGGVEAIEHYPTDPSGLPEARRPSQLLARPCEVAARGMEVDPVVVTAENFNSAAMRRAMDDPSKVKLFIFTVQALTKPTTETGRKTHKSQEGLGRAFYEHLDAQDDLVVFADEHHCYYGPGFSAAVRDLTPHALVGLTATPHKKTPEEQIIYRYPLAAAIADHLVKTPLLVGRKDDRTDAATKLHDGVRLLEAKQEAIARYVRETSDKPVNPVMLVIAQNIDEAEQHAELLRSPAFAGGRYAERASWPLRAGRRSDPRSPRARAARARHQSTEREHRTGAPRAVGARGPRRLPRRRRCPRRRRPPLRPGAPRAGHTPGRGGRAGPSGRASLHVEAQGPVGRLTSVRRDLVAT